MEKIKMNVKLKTCIILGAGGLLFCLWFWFFSGPVYPLWQKLESCLPEHIYFPVEEVLALNTHHNSPHVWLGSLLIAVITAALGLKLNGKLQHYYLHILLGSVLFVFAALFLQCLCRAAEYSKRIHCLSELHAIYRDLKLYAGNNNDMFPEKSDLKEIKHPVNYYGKGKRPADKTFVILEDACRIHAGDMRHRIWSDGTREQFYPWRNKK